MVENQATVEDVRVFYPGLTPEQEDQAEALLRVAWLRLLVIPGLNIRRRIEAGTLDQEVVSSVQGEMVANVLRNPEGARTRNETLSIDDYSETSILTIDQARSEGALFPTALMLTLIRENRRGAWTVKPS